MSRLAHADACRDFRWKDTLRVLGWAPDGPVDLAATIVDRHVGHGRPGLRWIGKSGASRTLSFDELSRLSAQVAAWLCSRGVREGDRVAGFLPRVPETIAIMLGTWRAGGVYVPIFTGFGPDAIAFRLRDSGARVLCTHWEDRASLPALGTSGVGLRPHLLHARSRPGRARDLPRGDTDARVRSPARERGRRHQH